MPASLSSVLITASNVAPLENSLAERTDVQAFIRAMVAKHGFDSNALFTLFSRARIQPEIITLITRPAEAKPWHAYRQIFLTPERVQAGAKFWKTHEEALLRAEQRYGVPAEIIVAIIGVETFYGRNTGRHKVLEALSTLAFAYPKRADFFRKELENYLLLTREEGIDPLALQGSYAGAMGLGQFMPSSYRAYAIDFNGDGYRDLWSNPEDAIGSVANYLSEHRWQRNELITVPAHVSGDHYTALITAKSEKPAHTIRTLQQRGVSSQRTLNEQQKAILLQLEGSDGLEYWLGFYNFYVITRYNRSPLYAMAVYQLSQDIRGFKEQYRTALQFSQL
jgi:membrane-bound lytic murein transglycosylase B